MEGRALVIASGDLKLEGLLHLPSDGASPFPGIVVCHPHPQYGGEMHNNVVYTVCRSALAHGIAALRFNFRGVGGSTGAYDNGRGERDDAMAALAHIRELPEIDSERIALAGYSFGAAVGLRVPDPGLRALVAVSAPTIGGPLTVDAPCPVLFISGDRDDYSEPAELQRVVDTLEGRAELEVMAGVDHFWAGSDDRLSTAVSSFLQRCL
jgi:hypothetical protein